MIIETLTKKFEELYQVAPQAISIAPGRVNLIGEFTDYNDGFVLPCALEYATRVVYRPREDDKIVVHSMSYPGEKDEFSVSGDIAKGDSQWGNYIRAMAFVFKRAGFSLKGVDLLIESDVPQGSGLSSSAALEVSIGGVFNAIGNFGLSEQKIAVLGQEAENDFMDCQCGIMDQLISAEGEKNHALLIDCENLETEAISIPEDLSIVIVNSNYPRKLVDSEYNQRRIDCEQAASKMGVKTLRGATLDKLMQAKSDMSENEYKRAHHVITENARVIAATVALKNNDMDGLRSLMTGSHVSLRDDFEVTVPATDGLVNICQAALEHRGAVRMTGGGFGGAIVCLCRAEDVDSIKAAVEENYEKEFNLTADIYVCKAGNGLAVNTL